VSKPKSNARHRRLRSRRSLQPLLENLEVRLVLAVKPHLNLMEFHDPRRIPAGLTPSAMGILPEVNGLPFPVGYEPIDIQTAYGINNIQFGSVAGDGTGQTIAIVDAYDDPSFLNTSDANFASSDLAQFDSQVGLSDPPSFTKVN
jgi:subtilase family serine protease